jgi:glycosyltransferase involved in cell wall biosynthesis
MRIVFVNHTSRREGGVETYLDGLMPALSEADHEVSLCYEVDLPQARDRIALPPGAPAWGVDRLGVEGTVAAIREWRPDVIFAHNVGSIVLERQIIDVAPAVLFAHDYHITCISGSKTFQKPVARPCERRFGWQCLVHFYPRRCGGLNPVTMLDLYRTQTHRVELMKKYKTVMTHSEHMRRECIRNGMPAERVVAFPYYVKALVCDPWAPLIASSRNLEPEQVWRLVFAGRMDQLKGGRLLLETLPLLRSVAGRPLHVVFAGDGPARQDWESASARLNGSGSDIRVEFVGWLRDAQLAALFRASDLLVMPMVWPEPFGTVGVQAAIEGLPCAAFGVGGISEWLIDGVTGHIASGDPPTIEGLTSAIMKCLGDRTHHLSLSKAAVEHARRFAKEAHVASLLRILNAVVKRR